MKVLIDFKSGERKGYKVGLSAFESWWKITKAVYDRQKEKILGLTIKFDDSEILEEIKKGK